MTEFVFRQPIDVPAEVSLVLGDVLHNLRSALDSLVFALTKDGLGEEMTPEQEKVCQFPIAETPEDFEKFFERNRTRKEMTTTELRAALRVPQWFTFYERAGREPTVEMSRAEVWFGGLHVLNRLSNIDKHRRLPISVWWPALEYWASEPPTQHRWEYLASWPLRDGDVVGRFTGPPDRPPVHHEFHLVAYDARPLGKASADLPRVAEDFHLVAVDARPWGEASADLPRVAEGYLGFVRLAIYQVQEAYFGPRRPEGE